MTQQDHVALAERQAKDHNRSTSLHLVKCSGIFFMQCQIGIQAHSEVAEAFLKWYSMA